MVFRHSIPSDVHSVVVVAFLRREAFSWSIHWYCWHCAHSSLCRYVLFHSVFCRDCSSRVRVPFIILFFIHSVGCYLFVVGVAFAFIDCWFLFVSGAVGVGNSQTCVDSPSPLLPIVLRYPANWLMVMLIQLLHYSGVVRVLKLIVVFLLFLLFIVWYCYYCLVMCSWCVTWCFGGALLILLKFTVVHSSGERYYC